MYDTYVTSYDNCVHLFSGAASTLFWVDPTNDLVAVFLTQMMGQNPAKPIHPPLITLVYGALADAAPARL